MLVWPSLLSLSAADAAGLSLATMECSNFPEMSLVSETRWSRRYRSADGRFERFDSRFLDGTATVTLNEVQAEWPRWNEQEKLDFSHAFAVVPTCPTAIASCGSWSATATQTIVCNRRLR
jgi:hypothetical protein